MSNGGRGLFESDFSADMRGRSGNIIAVNAARMITVAITEQDKGRQLIYHYDYATAEVKSLGWYNNSQKDLNHFSGFILDPSNDSYIHLYGSTYNNKVDTNMGFVMMLDTNLKAVDTNYMMRIDYFLQPDEEEHYVVTSFLIST